MAKSLSQELIKSWQQAVFSFSRSGHSWPKVMQEHGGHLEKIWRTYNQTRTELKRLPLNTAPWVAPYLLGFHLSNVGRLVQILDRLTLRYPELPKRWQQGRILDLGAGTGAATLAILETLATKGSNAWQIELFDRSRHFLKAAEIQIRGLNPNAQIKTLAAEILEPRSRQILQRLQSEAKGPQLITMSYVWNEIRNHRAGPEFFLRWFSAWAKSSSEVILFIADPAEENSAREMIELRDELCAMGFVNLYPCPQSQKCPMTSSGRDWCYSEVDFKKPQALEWVEKRLRISRKILGVSAYVFANSAAARALKIGETAAKDQVVVGRPRSEGQETWLVCSARGLARQPAKAKGGLRGSNYF